MSINIFTGQDSRLRTIKQYTDRRVRIYAFKLVMSINIQCQYQCEGKCMCKSDVQVEAEAEAIMTNKFTYEHTVQPAVYVQLKL